MTTPSTHGYISKPDGDEIVSRAAENARLEEIDDAIYDRVLEIEAVVEEVEAVAAKLPFPIIAAGVIKWIPSPTPSLDTDYENVGFYSASYEAYVTKVTITSQLPATPLPLVFLQLIYTEGIAMVIQLPPVCAPGQRTYFEFKLADLDSWTEPGGSVRVAFQVVSA